MMSYPSLEAVEQADKFQLGKWVRFLPSPGVSGTFQTQSEVLDVIVDRFYNSMGGWTPELSKQIGYDV